MTEGESRIYTVTQLTHELKALLEDRFPFVWIVGEISNARRPPSGHCYFTLKDDAAQINAVMFKGQFDRLKFDFEDGLKVTGFGRISVYEPRGTYQIIMEYVEPGGIGALQIAFEQLKMKLSQEGLFDDEHKQAPPFLPKKLCVITSPSGAVIHDIIHVAHRRFDNLPIRIVPVKVQGDDAPNEIVKAIEWTNREVRADVIILARGGGSLEDLAAFNHEAVARAIFNSKIPIVSAVGHETDYTIADFVADLRAPTPSAAAEMVIPQKNDIIYNIRVLWEQLEAGMWQCVEAKNKTVAELSRRMVNPKKRVQDLMLRNDDLFFRLHIAINRNFRERQNIYALWKDRLNINILNRYLVQYNNIVKDIHAKLLKNIRLISDEKRNVFERLSIRLHALNPMAILSKGYSITRTIPDAKIVKDPAFVKKGQSIEIIVEKGSIIADVKDRN